MKFSLTFSVFGLLLALTACGSANEEPTDAPPAESDEVSKTGRIAGSLSYPSYYVPEDMQVCAEETSSKEVTCKDGFEDDSYEMELPAGTYQVWARTDEAGGDYRAYYNEAVKCGLDVSCKDRTVIDVTIKNGETVADVDPADWYAQ